jgi:hypothetical protein
MITNITKLEVKIGERTYVLLCSCDSPLGELHDALMQMKSHIIEKMIEVDKQAEVKE